MKTIQKPFFRVLPMMLLSALCFVSCKPEEPQVENWCMGEWVNNERWYIGNDTVLNFEDKLTFSDKTFTLFHDTTGVWVDNISSTPRFGIIRYGTYRYEQYCAYLTFSDQPEDTYAVSVENDSVLNFHLLPINSPYQFPAMISFHRVNPPLPD